MIAPSRSILARAPHVRAFALIMTWVVLTLPLGAAQRRRRRSPKPPTVSAWCLGSLLDQTPLIGRSDGLIVAIDPDSGTTTEVFARHPAGVSRLAIDPTGEFVAASDTAGRVALWRIKCPPRPYEDVEDTYPGYGKVPEVVIVPEPRNWRSTPHVEWTPDGNHLVTESSSSLQVWTRAGELEWTGPDAHSLDMHPTKRRLAAVYEDRVLLGWPGEDLKVIELPGAWTDVHFSPDGARVAVGGKDHRVWVLDAEDGSVRKQRGLEETLMLPEVSPLVSHVCWSPSGRLLGVSLGPGVNPVILDGESLDTRWIGAPLGGRANEVFDVFWTPSERLVMGLGEVRVVDPVGRSILTFATGYDPSELMPLHDTPDYLITSSGRVSRIAEASQEIEWCRNERADGEGENMLELVVKGREVKVQGGLWR